MLSLFFYAVSVPSQRRPIRQLVWSASVLLMMFVVAPALVVGTQTADNKKSAWQTFREYVPGHFQDWIVDGVGPEYTLIFSEPPPAYTLDEYGALLKSVLRGYKSHEIATRPLGYNGEVRDLVVRLDYGFTRQDPGAELELDIAALSSAVYGTAHGARVLSLDKLADHSKWRTPTTVSLTAAQLQEWLFGENDPVTLACPELGVSGRLSKLIINGPAGRYLSSDNSVVVLLVDRDQGVDALLLPHIRTFAVDSDFILGGVGANTDAASAPTSAVQRGGAIRQKYVALVGRSRRLLHAQFPALRVEDIVNAMTADDQNWAQSYDRFTPGAGPVKLPDGSTEDWAPSYLSAELVDTEFGSLLNHTDAVLKSQSLSNLTRYRGYSIDAFPNPPYPEGVCDHLQGKIGLTSLIFNFNTVGVGHWLEVADGRRIYALNSTGTFSVTYSPDATGSNSTLDMAAPIDKAQTAYAAWFEKQCNPELVRTVQYLAIYQLFGGMNLPGRSLYEESRADKFKTVGLQLRESIKLGATAGFTQLKGNEQEKLSAIEKQRERILRRKSRLGLKVLSPAMPKTLGELTTAVAQAATAVRYDGNLFGDRERVLIEQIRARQNQRKNTLAPIEKDYKRLVQLASAFNVKYKEYEVGVETILVEGEPVKKTNYRGIPPTLQRSFDLEKAVLGDLEKQLMPVLKYAKRITGELEDLGKQLDALLKEYMGNGLLLEAVTSTIDRRTYAGEVFKEFAAHTETKAFPNSKYSICTPTIVVSVNKTFFLFRSRATGGHNVEVRKFNVRLDPRVNAGDYRLNGGSLTLNPADAPKMGAISARMARMSDADPDTQRAIFQAIHNTAPKPTEARLAALKLDPIGESGSPQVDKAVEASYAGIVDHSSSVRPASAVAIGRDPTTGRLFFDRVGVDGTWQRSLVFGATKFPEIIADHAKKKGAKVTEVVLEQSLGAHDIEAMIANYKNVRPAGAGGGGIVPPGNHWISTAAEPGERGPRMTIFIESITGKRRAVVETENGRVELMIPKEVDGSKVLEAMKTGIEQGAILKLRTESGGVRNATTDVVLVGFEIVQVKPVSGWAAVQAKAGAIFAKGADFLPEILRTGFADIKTRGNKGNTAADYVIEVNRRIGAADQGWKVVWKVEVDHVGLRFVLESIPCDENRSLVAIQKLSSTAEE